MHITGGPEDSETRRKMMNHRGQTEADMVERGYDPTNQADRYKYFAEISAERTPQRSGNSENDPAFNYYDNSKAQQYWDEAEADKNSVTGGNNPLLEEDYVQEYLNRGIGWSGSKKKK